MNRSPRILAGVAALMGAAGVALAAAGVHENGGELAEGARCFSCSPARRLESPPTPGSRPARRAR